METRNNYSYLSRIYTGLYYQTMLDFFDKISEFDRGLLKYESKNYTTFKKYFNTDENISIIKTSFSIKAQSEKITSTPFDIFEKELIINFSFFFFKKYNSTIEFENEKELFLELEDVFRKSEHWKNILYSETQNAYKFLNENKKISQEIKNGNISEFESRLTKHLQDFSCLDYFYRKNIFTIEIIIEEGINFYLEIAQKLDKNS